MSNLSLKKILRLFVFIMVLAVIVIGTYYIITMNSTLTALNSKIGEQQAIIADLEQTTPAPTAMQNNDAQIAELEILFNQKEAIIKNCREEADLINSEYSNNETFNEFCLKYNNYGLTYYIDTYNDIMSDITSFSKEYGKKQTDGALAALKYQYYDKYSDENEQKSIQAEGQINLLKTNYSDEAFEEIKSILNSIASPEI